MRAAQAQVVAADSELVTFLTCSGFRVLGLKARVQGVADSSDYLLATPALNKTFLSIDCGILEGMLHDFHGKCARPWTRARQYYLGLPAEGRLASQPNKVAAT